MTIARTICLGFGVVILLGTGLLMLPLSLQSGDAHSPLVALFTATSAVCVTGLIVVDTGSHFSAWGQFFILALIQIGGLGYMTTSTFLMLVLRRRFDLRQKVAIKSSFDRPFAQGSRHLMRSILAVTLAFELLGILGLFQTFAADYGVGQGLWLATFHSISAWNNAGFSLFADSLVPYQSHWLVNGVISGLIILGGIGYEVILELFLWGRSLGQVVQRRFSLNFKVVVSTTLALLLLGWFAFVLTEWQNPATLGDLSWSEQVLTTGFQSVTLRTAGFNTLDFGQMGDAALLVAIALMAIGASPSGTGGGVKTTTLRILLSCTRSTLQGRERVVMYGRALSNSLIFKAIAVLMGSGITVAIVTLLLAMTESHKFPFLHLFFEAVSAFATVGLSTGITAQFSAWGQGILILTMFIGRVGILVFIAALIGDPSPSQVKYPEENLLVG
ncbi:MAG: TrkH family potassium uptake protein [Cyanobacteria bacterium P01_G01_bin.54]